ncbi:hypothetical protein [Paenisporosarcina cavernae]|uniref:hypothetical protein n=1 Tax=Paenisporosarcina cavernae TaxID=2320858 RepID=UPI0013C515DB|nr:hypothetical protein [Paenisporosarcina cavernae]
MKIIISLMLLAVVAWSFFRPSKRGKMTFTNLINEPHEEKKEVNVSKEEEDR